MKPICYIIALVVLVTQQGFEEAANLTPNAQEFMEDDLEASMSNTIRNLEARVSRLEPLEVKVKELEQLVSQQGKGYTPDEVHIGEDNYRSFPENFEILDLVASEAQCPLKLAAFSAVLSDALQHLTEKQKILFNKVLLNKGNVYEPSTGVFTAPGEGVYLFIYSFGRHGTGETWLALMKNGEIQNTVAVEGSFGSQNLQGSNSAVLCLKPGDLVWVEVYHVNDVEIQGMHTTFSGVHIN